MSPKPASRSTRRTRRPQHATIRDVARAVGASISTVSAALNGTDYVSAAMRAKIEAAVQQLQYRPNDLARGLRLRRTHTLAIVVPDLSNSFYAEIVRGMKDYTAAANYTVLVGDSRERWAEEKLFLEMLHRRRVDGVVRVPAGDGNASQAAQVLGTIPVVYADRYPEADHPVAAWVGVDNARAAMDATQYLISLGHRRIAIISGPTTTRTAAERLEGYQRALRGIGAMHKEYIRNGELDMAGGARQAIELLTQAKPPTAIFCANNTMTLGALEAIQQLGRACPREISLLGFDDFAWSTLLRPRLTMVRQPAREIGMTAGRMLIDTIEERTRNRATQTLPTQLMVRDSCAPPLRP